MEKHLVIDSRPFGMFSIFLHTIDCLKWSETNGYIPHIRWSSGRIDTNKYRKGATIAISQNKPELIEDKNNFVTENNLINNSKPCLYLSSPQDNAWNYYFQPINDNMQNISKYDVADIFMCGELDFNLDNKFLIRNIHSYDSLKLWSLAGTEQEIIHRNEVNNIIKKYVKFNQEITNKVDKFISSKLQDELLIGVHIRGTDKKTEYPYKQLTIDDYIREIKDIIKINKNKKYKIYIASDNNEGIIKIANIFGKENICAYPSFRVNQFYGSIPICLLDNIDKKLHGEQTIIEMLILTKCHYIIGTDSNFTAAACYFNPKAELIYLDRKYGI